RKAGPQPIGSRPVFDGRSGKTVDVPMIDRATMTPGAVVAGPAIIVEAGTSTFVTATFDAELDAGYGLVLTAKAGAANSAAVKGI
ncbi:hypothetical protein, partial [Enterobacter hormaechei]|uniref:hypothetical protein n=1 Tax=Enterobacter hormaechei TaxID=158836 RepID=UPI001952F9F7